MKSAVVLSLGAIACGGASHSTPKPNVPRYDDHQIARWGSVLKYTYIQAKDGSWDMVVADGGDGTIATTRIHHVDPKEEPLFAQVPAGHNIVGVPLIGADGEKLTQFYRKNWAATAHDPDPPMFTVSPPLKRAVGFHMLKAVETVLDYTFAVPAGSAEPELYLPITQEGQLAFFPDGVIGVKPMYAPLENPLRPDYLWAYWLVRWGKPKEGWSLAKDPDLEDLDLGGPQWISTEVRNLYDPLHEYYDYLDGETFVLLGKRADGSCDANVVGQDKKWNAAPWPQPSHGATCEEARKAMQNNVTFARKDINARDTEARLAQQAEERAHAQYYATAEQTSAFEARNWEDDAPLIAQYKTTVVTSVEDACKLSVRINPSSHIRLIDQRESSGELRPGELACLIGRPMSVDDQARVRDISTRRARAERDRQAKVQADYAQQGSSSGISYAPPSGPTTDERIQAIEDRIKAMEAYSHGAGGICPFERYLCP